MKPTVFDRHCGVRSCVMSVWAGECRSGYRQAVVVVKNRASRYIKSSGRRSASACQHLHAYRIRGAEAPDRACESLGNDGTNSSSTHTLSSPYLSPTPSCDATQTSFACEVSTNISMWLFSWERALICFVSRRCPSSQMHVILPTISLSKGLDTTDSLSNIS